MATRTRKHAAPKQRSSLRRTAPRALGVVALVATTSAATVQGGAFATAGAGASAVPLPQLSVAAGGAPQVDTRTVRVSRDSSRQVLAASGGSVQPPSSAEGRQANGDLKKLAASAEKLAGQMMQDAWQLPIPKGHYVLTARFGQCSYHWAHCHTGLDFAAATGTPIHAVAGGVIKQTGWAGAYGNRTVEQLEDGTVLWYAHQNAIAVKPGEQVVGGQVIGYVGATGNTTGPHLHLEVRPGGGDPVDPFQALTVRGLNP